MSKLEQLLTQIAQSKLGIETLETRKSDSLCLLYTSDAADE